MSYKLEIAT